MIRLLLLPLVKKYRKLFISMILVSSLGIALMVGLSGAYNSLETSLNKYVEEYRYADLVITTSDLVDRSLSKNLMALGSVRSVNPRLIADTSVRLDDGRIVTMRAMSFSGTDFQKIYIWEMNQSADLPNVAVEKKFAEDHGLHTGDKARVLIDGEEEEVCIGYLISSPECLSVQQDEYSWGENSDFGFAFLPEELMIGSDDENHANQFLIEIESWASEEETLEEAKKLLEDKGIELGRCYTYADSAVNRKIEINLQPIESLSLLLPGLFFACMIAVVTLFLSQIIRQCRREIGIMRALGFSQAHVRTLFNAIALVVTIFGVAIGLFVGLLLMNYASRMYGDFFSLPFLILVPDVKRAVIAAVITIFAGQISAFLSTMSIARIAPSEAMSREAPAAFRIPEWVNKILYKASPRMKFAVMSIFRNVKRFVFSVFCVAASLTLILSAVAFNQSKNEILVQLYDVRTHYEAQVFLKGNEYQEILEGLEALPGTTDCERLDYLQTTASANGKETDILVNALKPDTQKVVVQDAQGKKLEIPESGILLEKHAAEELGVTVGDSITLDNSKTLTVTGISYMSLNRIQYVSLEQMKELGEADCTTILCNTKDQQALLDYAVTMEDYSHTNFMDVMRAGNEKTFATYSLAVYILITFAVVLGLLIVYNTMQTNLFEQKKQLAVMRAIGFQISDISRIWMVQSLSQFVFSMMIGLPAGTAIAKYVLSKMETDGREYPFSRDPSQFFVTVALVLSYILVSHYLSMRSIKKWNIPECTKEKD